ncbi:MAG: STAS domain-containing protein [Sedimentisphaerales bacterium]|nr:STAS domain-containing protein [Sedimentisphaerales bacterium]
MELKVGIEYVKRGMVILSPVGSIDTMTCELLDKEIKNVLKRSVTTLVLDMASVDFVTSRGVSTIAKTRAALVKKGGDLAIMNLQPQVQKAFEIMCLVPALNVFSGRDELDEYLGKVQRKIVENNVES